MTIEKKDNIIISVKFEVYYNNADRAVADARREYIV
jgi:hypothetical protein